jgi:hypothetical protein
MIPNFPMSDDLLVTLSKNAPKIGDEEERKSLYDFLVTLIKTQPFFDVFDCPEEYKDDKGFINTACLELNDIHVSDYQYFLKDLEKFILNHEN